MKSLYILGVFALLGGLAVNADGGFEEGDSAEEGRCSCGRGTCAKVTGSQAIGCPNTNSFRQCNGANCTVQTCPSGQVWSFTKSACSQCDAGKQVSTNLQVCVCKTDTTWNEDTQACGPCPSGATVQPDRCFCNSSLYALDEANNECKACPTGATLKYGDCVCNNATQFFSEASWTCNACPGTLEGPRRGRYSCSCKINNQVFNEENVSCYTCPVGTTADKDNDECKCAPNTGLEFDFSTGVCACEPGYTLASGVCTKNA